MFFIFFISPLTLVKPLPVTERTQLLYKTHRCVHVHSRAPIHAVFDDTGNFFRFLVLHFPLAGSRRPTQFPRRRETRDDPSDFLRSRAHGKDSVFPDTDYKPYTHFSSRFLPPQFSSLISFLFFFFLPLFFFFLFSVCLVEIKITFYRRKRRFTQSRTTGAQNKPVTYGRRG